MYSFKASWAAPSDCENAISRLRLSCGVTATTTSTLDVVVGPPTSVTLICYAGAGSPCCLYAPFVWRAFGSVTVLFYFIGVSFFVYRPMGEGSWELLPLLNDLSDAMCRNPLLSQTGDDWR